MLTVGSLFAGIGGFDLGLERAGMQVKWQVEIDPYCLKVLEKHWPHVRRYTDIKQVRWEEVEPVDLVCGGFPCQDLSVAGKQKGITGERSGLWSEYVRCLRALRPRYVLVENVPGLLAHDAMGRVLGDLADCGYDAEWQIISAAAVGAPHLRKRVWIVAYPYQPRSQGQYGTELPECAGEQSARESGSLADADSIGQQRQNILQQGRSSLERCSQTLADSKFKQRHRWSDGVGWWQREPEETLRALGRNRRQEDGLSIPESLLGRVADGIPFRVDRLRSLGNAVVPQVVEWIGRQIVKAEGMNKL